MSKYKLFEPDEYFKPLNIHLTITPHGKFNTVTVNNLSLFKKYFSEITEQFPQEEWMKQLYDSLASAGKRDVDNAKVSRKTKKMLDADDYADLYHDATVTLVKCFLAECNCSSLSSYAQQEQEVIGQAESVYKAAKAKDNIIRPILALLAFIPFLYECFCVWKAFSATDSMVMKVIYGIIVLAALLLVFLKAKAHKLLWYSTADDEPTYEFSYLVRRFGKMTKTYLLATLYTWLIAAAMYGLLFAIDWLAGLFS